MPFIHHNRTTAEDRFNHALCKTQSKVEWTLGILQNRFGSLLKRLCVHGPEYACKVITGCLVMYNICVLNQDHIDPLMAGRHLDASELTGDNSMEAGQARRQHIVNTYFS